jgi:hypothetical protein
MLIAFVGQDPGRHRQGDGGQPSSSDPTCRC